MVEARIGSLYFRYKSGGRFFRPSKLEHPYQVWQMVCRCGQYIAARQCVILPSSWPVCECVLVFSVAKYSLPQTKIQEWTRVELGWGDHKAMENITFERDKFINASPNSYVWINLYLMKWKQARQINWISSNRKLLIFCIILH